MSPGQTSSAAPAISSSSGDVASYFRRTLPSLLPLVAFAAGLWPRALMNDSDTLWHLSAGQYMLDHRQILTRDPFSLSFYDRPWHTHEWLSEILMSLIYKAAGWSGLMVLSAACLAVTVFICANYARRYLSGLTLGLILLVGLSLIGPHYLIRPHLFILPLMAGLLSALMRARDADTSPPLALSFVFLLWANMHASFIFGLALIGFLGFEAVMAAGTGAARLKACRDWGSVLALSAVACLITPQGFEGFLFPLKLIFMPGIEGIAEWGAADLTRPTPLLIALAVGVYGLIRLRVKMSVWRAGLLLSLTGLSLAHIRHEMVLGLVAIFILSAPLAQAMGTARPRVENLPPSMPGSVAFTALAVMVLRLLIVAPEPATPLHPHKALAQVPESLRHQAVLNDYDFGGFLIAEGVRPFIDGRADMYGADFLKTYDAIMADDSDGLGRALDKQAIQWTLLKPQSHAASQLAQMPGWRQIYADQDVIIHARNERLEKGAALPPLSPLRDR